MATAGDNEEPLEEVLTPQERTISYILNSLSGAFQSTKAVLNNIDLFLFANPLETEPGKTVTPQQTIDLLGKQGTELLGICDDGKAFLNRVRMFLQSANAEVVATQRDSVKAAEIAAAVKAMADDKGADIVERKPADVEVVKNADGSVTMAAVEAKP